MTSSAIPSAKNSCSGSALILVNGRTATEGLSGSVSAGTAIVLGRSEAVEEGVEQDDQPSRHRKLGPS
jgi:hypothetical protein